MRRRAGIRRVSALLGAGLAILACAPVNADARGRCGAHPWCDTSLSPDRRADLLMAAMSPGERVELLGGDDVTGVAGGPHAHTGTQNGVPRLDVPTVHYTDGPQGPRQGKVTGLPSPLALAATWDPALARAYGAVVGREARDKGNDVVFGPNVNIMRTPLGGRTFEAYGEDPFLVARTAVAWIRGAQAQGVIADVKHFAANNQEGYSPQANESRPGQVVGPSATEGSRFLIDARVAARTLQEVELPAFRAAVQRAHVGTVMCSYNMLNGAYACQNRKLLTTILRGWGFKGFVLSDYGAVHDLVPSLRAGLDFEPWPGTTLAPIPIDTALAAGQLKMADVDRAAHRILRTFFAYGLFDRAAYRDDDAQIAKRAHARTARRVEENATTLLVDRRHTLPLRAHRLKSIALLGAGIDRFVTGGGSGNVTPFRVDTLTAAVRHRVGAHTTVLADDGSDPAKAAALARRADVAVIVAPDYLTEGNDRACLTLECPPAFGDEDALIRAVAAANRRTIVVLETGGPVLTPWRGKVAGLLEAWYPGQEGGPALARVLFGDADPGGRLPVTFPRSAAQLPTAGDPHHYPGVNQRETYAEGLLVGYRWWDAKHLRPAFPFGAGLSYASFAFGRPAITRRGARRFVVALRVRNTSTRSGTTVAQLYLAHPRVAHEPPRTLVGAVKLRLRAGASRRVVFHLGAASLRIYSARRGRWVVVPGRYRVTVGSSSRALGRPVALSVR